MSELTFIKDPQATRTFGVYWGTNLADGDTIATATWTVPSGLTKVSEGANESEFTEANFTYPIGTVAQVRLSGGTAGVDYSLLCHIVTTVGDEDDQTVIIECRDK